MMLSTGCTTVKPGETAVKVILLGKDKGVDSTKVYGPGRYFDGPNVQYIKYPTFVSNYPFTKGATEGSDVDEEIRFQAFDGTSCGVDVAIQARTSPELARLLYITYRMDMMDIIKNPVRNMLRDIMTREASAMAVDSLVGPGKITLIDNVQRRLKAEMLKSGLIIESVTMLSEIRPPEAIAAEIVQKNVAIQSAIKAENQKRVAEANKEITRVNAEAQSIANRQQSESLTPLVLQEKWIAKWNGVLPTLVGDGRSLNMFVNTGR
jgi:regulator of protease activity HflC (stomatin/prohibitin superfamily)